VSTGELIRSPPRGGQAWFSRSCRRAGWFVLGGLLCLGGHPARGADAEVSKEYQVKAAFLYNFTKFVEWPAASFADETSPIVIGVLGQNPFGHELEKIVQGRTVNRRTISVIFIPTAAEMPARHVHLLFVPAGEETRLPATVWRDAAVVAVGESARFIALGGTIVFTREADKIHFVINLESAERAGLKISAQLLKLATAVHRQP
jgi:hypothetical protein